MASSPVRKAVPTLVLLAGILLNSPGCSREPPPAHASLPELAAVIHEMQTEMAALQREMDPPTQGNSTGPTAASNDPVSPAAGPPIDPENLSRELALLQTRWHELRDKLRARTEASGPDDKRNDGTRTGPDRAAPGEPTSIARMPDETASPPELLRMLVLLRRKCALQESLLAEQKKQIQMLRLFNRLPASSTDPDTKQNDTAEGILNRIQEKYRRLQERLEEQEKKD